MISFQANQFCESSVFYQEVAEGVDNKFCIIENWTNEEECDKDCQADYVMQYIKELGDTVSISIRKLKAL